MIARPLRLARLLAVLAVLLWSAQPLRAQEGSIPDSAETVKAEVQALLDSFVAGTRYWQGVPITFNYSINGFGPNIDVRDPTIENLHIRHIEEGRFRVRFTNIKVQTIDGAPVTLGSVQFILVRLGEGRYAVEDFFFRGPFWIADPEGALKAQVTFVNPVMEGVNSIDLNSFELLDFRADRLVVVPTLNSREMKMRNPRFLREVRRIEDSGLYDAFTRFEAQDIDIKGDPDGKTDSRLEIDFFAVDLDFEDADLDAIDFNVQEGDPSNPGPQSAAGSLIATTYRLEGLSMVRPGLDLGMGDLTLDVSLDLRDEEDGRLKAAADLRGLALESEAFNALGLDKRLLPNDLAVVFSASEMPSQVLGRLFTETFTVSGTIGPDGAEGDTTATSPAGDAAPLSIPSGKLLLEDLLLVSPIMRVTATGSGQIAEDAALGLSGSISSEISGMEALQALLQEMTQNEDPEIAGMALEALVGIGVVMGFAQGPETPEPETPGALTYLLRLDPDGAFMVNGLPVSQP